MLPSSCLSQVLLSLTSPPPPDTGQACAFLRDTKGNDMGIFSQFSGRTHGKYVCDPRSNPRTTRKEKGKGAKRVGEGKGRRVGN